MRQLSILDTYNLGCFDDVLHEVDDTQLFLHYVGKTAPGAIIQEVYLSGKYFTKIPLRECSNKHPVICGITKQQANQYSG